jgi:hypothetical protein
MLQQHGPVLRNGFVVQEIFHFSKLLPEKRPMESLIDSETNIFWGDFEKLFFLLVVLDSAL